MKALISLITFCFLLHLAHADHHGPVLLEINGTEVSKDEFLYIYEKNNPNIDDLYDEDAVRDYLEMFINFKLKVHEAKKLGLDTTEEFVSEFSQYREDLARPYMTSQEKLDELVREAYERMQREVRASHILIRVDEEAPPADTKKAYNQLQQVRDQYLNGEKTFEELAIEHSEDPSVSQNSGELGFFSAFQMTYPFESAVYNLEDGEVSEPFRTRFGYHIAKRHESRPNTGEIEVAHIMVSPQNQRGADPEDIIDSVAYQLEQGADFGELAGAYSDDQYTAGRGGRLDKFRQSERNLPEKFVETAFSLEEDGDVSEPFQTQYGWHIIKRISKDPLPSFEEQERSLRERVKNSDRADLTEKAAVKMIKEEHGFDENRWNFLWFNRSAGLDESVLEGEWEYDGGGFWSGRRMFTIGEADYSREDFARYIESEQTAGRFNSIDDLVAHHYSNFVKESVLQYQRNNLEKHYPSYRNILREYRDGLLLFEVMEQKVWNRATQDTAGLRRFYEENREQYKRGPVATVNKYTLEEEDVSVEGKTANWPGRFQELYETGRAEREEMQLSREEWNNLHTSGSFKKGSFAYSDKDNPEVLYHVLSVQEEVIPELSQVRGRVSSDYQDYLEEKWLEELKAKYDITVDDNVLEEIINR